MPPSKTGGVNRALSIVAVLLAAIAVVLALTAVRRPHGGFWQGQLPITLPAESFTVALKPE